LLIHPFLDGPKTNLRQLNSVPVIPGNRVQIFPTARHPVVYGEYLEAGESAPTALVYGHYDVQPVDPVNLWISGPFSPEVREDYIFGRGITDMKGQMLVALNAFEAISKTSCIPINFKFLFEGERNRVTKSGLFPESHKELLKSDVPSIRILVHPQISPSCLLGLAMELQFMDPTMISIQVFWWAI
jgi:hypothetical protein